MHQHTFNYFVLYKKSNANGLEDIVQTNMEFWTISVTFNLAIIPVIKSFHKTFQLMNMMKHHANQSVLQKILYSYIVLQQKQPHFHYMNLHYSVSV